MKKLIALLLALVLALGCFAGCSSNQNTTPTTGSVESNDATQVAPTEAEELYTIDFYYCNFGDKTDDLQAVQDAMNAIVEPKIGATIVLHSIDNGEWQEKTNLMFTSGKTKYDLISSSAGLQPTYINAADKGAYLAIDELLEQYGQDIINACGADFIEGCRVDGKLYGVPINKEKGSAYGFMFNKALVEQFNIDLSTVKTYADLEEIFATVAAADSSVTPLCMSGRNIDKVRVLAGYGDYFSGLSYLPADTTDYQLIPLWENEGLIEMLKWANDMYKAGYINESALTDTDQGPFKAGKALCMPYEINPGKDDELSASFGFEVEQLQLCEPYTPYSQAQGICLSIGRNCENPVKTMQFLNLLYSDVELLNTLVYGVEGKHWVKVDGTENIITYPEGVTSENVGYSNHGWVFGDQMLNYLRDTEDPMKWENYRKFNENAITTAVGGLTMDLSELKTITAAIGEVNDQYKTAIFCGFGDFDTAWEQYISALKQAGIEELYAAEQAQIDAWVKANIG